MGNNAILPLMDKTESRYAEIARLMMEKKDFVSLYIAEDELFWGKPPLSTWLSVFAMKAFGQNEFAVRLPSIVLAVVILLLVISLARNMNIPAIPSAIVLLTIPEFFIHSGVVSTDMSLLLCVTLTMVSFWKSIQTGTAPFWNLPIFIGIGLGLLAKGPIMIILTLVPMVIFAIGCKEYRPTIIRIPWIFGMFIIFLITAPWYVLAELKTPGFLEYFLVGEHFMRYFEPSWPGDKYGFAKSTPIGIIWVYFVLFTLPYSLLAASIVFRKPKLKLDPHIFYLLLWICWPLVFFSASSSVIHPYILPALPPLALLTCQLWSKVQFKLPAMAIAMLLPVAGFVLILLHFSTNIIPNFSNTDKYVIPPESEKKIFMYQDDTYSARFYSNGNISLLFQNDPHLQASLVNQSFIIIRHKDLQQFHSVFQGRVHKIKCNQKKCLYFIEDLCD